MAATLKFSVWLTTTGSAALAFVRDDGRQLAAAASVHRRTQLRDV